MQLYIPLVYHILSELPTLTPDRLKDLQRDFAKAQKLTTLPSKSQILQAYFHLVEKGVLEKNSAFEQLLRKRAIRSLSGIVSVQVLTKPRPCPGKCIFCPNDVSMPKSYIKSEPGAMRAFLNQFDAVKQVWNRLQSLTLTGHTPDKIEMIVLGGSWDAYTEEYKMKFIQDVYDACTTFSQLKIQPTAKGTAEGGAGESKKYGFQILNAEQIQFSATLEEALERNQLAKNRVIGLTIETRPDFVTHTHCQQWRQFGITRIEMGVQTTDDEILGLNKRGHTIEQVRQAVHLMRQYGFKISLHLMPGLYGSSVEKDIQTFREVFSDVYLKPDELKVYPTSVIPNTELYRLYQEGAYQPITTEEILRIIRVIFQEIIPPYTRIKRLIRDIPAPEIAAGSSITNLSQLAHTALLDEYQHNVDAPVVQRFYHRLWASDELITTEVYEGDTPYGHKIPPTPSRSSDGTGFYERGKYRHFVSLDTRSREVRNKKEQTKQLNLVMRKYQSSVGSEFFISYEDELGYLYGFIRLLLPDAAQAIDFPGLGQGTAIVRELHVYGVLQTFGEKSEEAVQHSGLGKKLLRVAEHLSAEEGFSQLSVISGVGVREYYAKLGYTLSGTYMVKKCEMLKKVKATGNFSANL